MTGVIALRPESRRGRRARRPGFEGLEPRRVLAVYFTQVPGYTPDPYAITSVPGGPIAYLYGDLAGTKVEDYDTNAGSIDPITHASVQAQVSPVYHQLSGLPGGMTIGPDGNAWFTDPNQDAVGLYNPTNRGSLEIPLPAGSPGPATSIAAGPDGDLWFTLPEADEIGSINPTTYAISIYPVPTANSYPLGITAGPDGNLWFTELAADQIGEIDPTTHVISEYAGPSGARLGDITAGPDGNLWFIEAGAVGSINPTTHDTASYTAEATNGIAVGPDGNIWFTDVYSNSLGTIDLTTHAVSEYPIPTGDGAVGLVTGSDGNLWLLGDSFVIAQVVPAEQGVVQSTVTAAGSAINQAGAPLAGRTVFLDLKGDGTLDPGDPSAVTNAVGGYSLRGVAPGDYTLRLATYPGDAVTSAGGAAVPVVVAGGQITAPSPFVVASQGTVLPLTLIARPFGTDNPNLATAEVTGLYNVLLGRAPDAPGLAFWVGALDGGTPLAQVAADLLHSAEYETGLITADYETYLGRAPDAPGLAAWVAAMGRGETAEEVAAGLLDSAEYGALHATDADFVQSLYVNLLGRPAAATEVSAWTALMGAGSSRPAVVAAALGSAEWATRSVNGLYLTLLGRAADPPGLSVAAAAVTSGELTLSGLAAALAGSPEFVADAGKAVGTG